MLDPTLSLNHEAYLRRAIALARSGADLPFGAVIAHRDTGRIVAEGSNRSDQDPTMHGEIAALRDCAQKNPGIDWSRLVLYTTAEPCPMCAAAAWWAGLHAIVYGSSIPYLRSQGWRQIDIRAEEVFRRTSGGRSCQLAGGVLEEECNVLYQKSNGGRVPPENP